MEPKCEWCGDYYSQHATQEQWEDCQSQQALAELFGYK